MSACDEKDDCGNCPHDQEPFSGGGMMNKPFWLAVLSVPDDEEAQRMLDMLEVYERQQWEAERRRVEARMVEELTKMRAEE